MIKILIADDHSIVRKGMRQIISEEPNMQVVDEASNGFEMLRKLDEKECDVVVLDISMPGRSGIDILKDMNKNSHPPVLILSMYPEEQYAVRALRAGAAGYLTKDSIPEELVSAIQKVAMGRRYITTSLAEKLAFEVDERSDRPLHSTLSDREFEVLQAIASGKSVTKIAQELCLSVKTISTYRSRILEKMKLNNNAELIHYAVECELA